ncbi:MAG: hypothetical protein LBS20_21595 [Prevotella sp.]|jgi:hypothetical protein|nr:hypothetical protein [Prevotella sp.]
MIIRSEGMAQDEFIRKVIERDILQIFRAQRLIQSQSIYFSGKSLKEKQEARRLGRRTGRLENALSNPEYYLQSLGEDFTAAAVYPIYIRFLDMPRKGNWKIYNRQIWGIIYNNALKDIRYNYGNEIHSMIEEKLLKAFNIKSRGFEEYK